MHIDEDTHHPILPHDRTERVYLLEKRAPIKQQVSTIQINQIRKNNRPPATFPFPNKITMSKNKHPDGRSRDLREKRTGFRLEPASYPPCLEVATLGAQGVTASAVGAL